MDKAYTESCTSSRNDVTTVTWKWPADNELYRQIPEAEQVVVIGAIQPECFNVVIIDDGGPEVVRVSGFDEAIIARTKELFEGY